MKKFIQEKIYHITYKESQTDQFDKTIRFIANNITEAIEMCYNYSHKGRDIIITNASEGSTIYRPSTKTITVDI